VGFDYSMGVSRSFFVRAERVQICSFFLLSRSPTDNPNLVRRVRFRSVRFGHLFGSLRSSGRYFSTFRFPKDMHIFRDPGRWKWQNRKLKEHVPWGQSQQNRVCTRGILLYQVSGKLSKNAKKSSKTNTSEYENNLESENCQGIKKDCQSSHWVPDTKKLSWGSTF